MKVIVFAKTKGGVAASTLCYNVALLAAVKSQVFLIDRDPQASLAKMWYARNELINPRLITDVESVGRSVRLLSQAGFDRDYAFVDTPGSMMPIITDALSAADLIVVPTQPGQLDLWGQDAVIGRIEQLGLSHKMMFVLTRTQGTKAGLAEVEKAKRHLRPLLQRSPHLPTMSERIDYRRAAENGKAAWEVSKSKDIKSEIETIWSAMRAAMKVQDNEEQSNVVPLTR